MPPTELQEHQLEEERRLGEIEHTLASLTTEMQELKTSVSELVTAWKAASWVISFVKGLGAISVAVGATYALFHGGK